MLLINMRIFKTVLLIASLSASVRCLPVDGGSKESQTEILPLIDVRTAITSAPTSEHRLDTDYYDQQQNGSENYRIHVDGLMLVFAPVEALFLAGNAGTSTTEPNLPINHGGFVQISGGGQTIDKPAVGVHNKTEPAISKMIQR